MLGLDPREDGVLDPARVTEKGGRRSGSTLLLYRSRGLGTLLLRLNSDVPGSGSSPTPERVDSESGRNRPL